jgi:hypothetical protein
MAFKRKREVTPKGFKRVKRSTQNSQQELKPRHPTDEEQMSQVFTPCSIQRQSIGPRTSLAVAPDESHLEALLSRSSEHLTPNMNLKSQSSCRQRPNTPDLQAPQILPAFISRISYTRDVLYMTSLINGKQSRFVIPLGDHLFRSNFCVSEMQGGNLLLTGGNHSLCNFVTRIDTRREFALFFSPPMLSARAFHAAVYHDLHLYVIGGRSSITCLKKCERYVCEEDRWEALHPLPISCCLMSGVVIEKSLYALGGQDEKRNSFDLVQRLSLESLTWELLELRLPFAGCGIPCFKVTDTEVYLVVNKTLCEFTALKVRPITTLTKDIQCVLGASYYHKGILYCYQYEEVCSYKIGSL